MHQDVLFLSSLLAKEFVGCIPNMESLSTLQDMQTRGLVDLEEGSLGVSMGKVGKHLVVARRGGIEEGGVLDQSEGAGLGYMHIVDDLLHEYLCSFAWPLIDGYYVTLLALKSLVKAPQMELQEIKSRTIILAQSLYHEHYLGFYEGCSSALITNALETYVDWDIVDIYTRVVSGMV